MKKIELLSPVGDFECLKAAVQNGANCVYLGASSFNARARATNFSNDEELKYLFFTTKKGIVKRTKVEEFERKYDFTKDNINFESRLKAIKNMK